MSAGAGHTETALMVRGATTGGLPLHFHSFDAQRLPLSELNTLNGATLLTKMVALFYNLAQNLMII